MSDLEEYGPPDGSCVDCGEPTEEEHHWRCSDCYAREQGWRRPPRPEPRTEPPSFVEGLATVREVVENNYLVSTAREAQLQVELEQLEKRVAALEGALHARMREGAR